MFKVDADQRLFQESDVEQLVVEDHGKESKGKATPDQDEAGIRREPVAASLQSVQRNDSQESVFHEHRQVKGNHFGSCVTLPAAGKEQQENEQRFRSEDPVCEMEQRVNK